MLDFNVQIAISFRAEDCLVFER